MYSKIHSQISQLRQQFKELQGHDDYEQAFAIGNQIENLARKYLKKSYYLDFTDILNGIAVDYKYMANYEESERLFKEAIDLLDEMLEKRPTSASAFSSMVKLGDSWLNLAGLYEAMGQYTNAMKAIEEASGIYEYLLKYSLPINNELIYLRYAICLSNTALLLVWTGSYDVAKKHLYNALVIHHKHLDDTHQKRVIDIMMNLGYVCAILGDYQEAIHRYEEALKLSRKVLTRSDPDFIKFLIYLVTLYKKNNDHEKAEQIYKQAQEIRREITASKQENTAIALHNLAYLYEEMKNQEEALHLHEESLKILREVLGSERSLKSAGVFISLADLHKKMGNYGKSLHLLESALEIYRGFLGTEHPLYGEVLHRLVVLYAAANRTTDVLNCLQQITTISQRTISQVFSTGTEKVRLDYSATIRNEIDQFLSMALHFHRSPEIVHAALDLLLRRKAINLEVLAIQQDTVLKGKYPHLKLKLQELTVVRRNIAAKTLARLGEQDLAAHQQSLEKLERRRQMMESQLAREIPEMTLEHSLKNANIPNVSSALLTGTALVEFVRTEYCIFPKLSTQPNDWNKPARYLAFVLLAGEPDSVQMIDLGEAEAIDQMIAKFRVSITGEGENRNPENVLQELIQAAQTINVAQLRAAIFQPLQEYGWTKTEPIPFRKLTPVPKKLLQNVSTSIGYTLRKTLFDSLLKAIGDRKRLFLAPDGDLSKLPFEILPLDENRRLIDEYHISYLSSGRDVLRFQVATNHQPSEPLVFADPDFDLCVAKSTTATEKVEISGRHSQDLKRNTLYFQRLPGTRIEGEKIAERLGVKPLLEGKVLETSLKACCSPHILHLATHGFFLKNQKRDPQLENLEYLGNIDRLSGHGLENPLLRSGLALAGANTWLQGKSLPPEAEDGILTAEDVSGLDLLDTELVVLSACETGLGEICTGEGVFGLRRAFVLAGAKRLVMSLWQVPDQQTQELMTDFYERILKGQPCADALREAQLEIKKKYPNPLYWGAFICQGQPDSIHKVTVNVKGHRLMGKERQEAYVNLAHALLEFSDDNQAHELLSVNHELVDAGLVETMEQVSAKLKQEGDCKAANSLRTIAVQLAAALDNPLSAGTPVESLMLLTQLFRATVSSQGNHQVVFPLLEANLNKLDEHFAQFLKHWSAAALSTVHPSQSILIVHGLFTLGNLIQEFPSGDRVSNLEIAQVCDEIVQKCNREILEEAIRLDPYDPLPQRTLAEVLEAQGRYDEAARAYQETSRVLFRKAEAWLQLCRYDEGLQALDEVLALEPNNALALASRGETLRHLGRYQDAVVSYDKALEFKPDNDQHWYNKACCYALQNNIDLALENLEQAISLNPECLEIAKNDLDLLEVREDERFQKLMKRTTNE